MTRKKTCKKCGLKYRPGEDDDPCIKNLPGVMFACCGHGQEGYIYFKNGIVIRGQFEIEKRETEKEQKKIYG